jgi:hypothetical protein
MGGVTTDPTSSLGRRAGLKGSSGQEVAFCRLLQHCFPELLACGGCGKGGESMLVMGLAGEEPLFSQPGLKANGLFPEG